MTITRSIVEEYWTLQYKTRVSGHREPIFWPPDGEGKWGTEVAAQAAAENMIKHDLRQETRVLHVERRTEFGDPIRKANDDDV